MSVTWAITGGAVAVAVGVVLLYRWRCITNREHPRFRALYASAIRDVIDACRAEGLRFWFVEGTLIGLLRYGSVTPEGIADVVDDDIDIMIEADSQADWQRIADALARALRRRGWRKAAPIYSTSRKRGARRDKLQCFKFDGLFFRTHVDVHSYFVDRERGVLVVHGDGESYPFQRWNGALPVDWVEPMGTALCDGEVVPSPRRPVEVLKLWNGGEYEGSSLAFPLRPITDDERAFIVAATRRLAADGHASMVPELDAAEGATDVSVNPPGNQPGD